MRVGIKKVFSKVLLWGCLAAVFAHVLTSCSFFQEEDVDDDVVAFNAMQEAAIAQGLTLDLLPPGEAAAFYATISGTASTPGDLTRTALPSISTSSVEKILLRNKTNGTTYAAELTGSFFTFGNIEPGTYNFLASIGGVSSGPYDYMLADGTEGTDLVLAAGQNLSGMTLKIVPKMSADGKGSINLTVNRSSDSGITYLNYSLTGSGGSGSLNFDASGKALISVPYIASGTYTLALTFMAGTSPVYHAVEVVNVYDGLDTNTWQGSSEYINGITGVFTVTKAMVDNFARTTFYVKGTGSIMAYAASDENEGTYFKPFATLSKAVSAVSSSTINPGTGGFRIFIDGSLTEHDIIFSPASSRGENLRTLTISSIGTNAVTIDADNKGRVLTVGSSAILTLVNLVMQKGKSQSGSGGGGILVNPGANLTLTGCTVKDCQATFAIGGGILCDYGSGTTTLSMTNTKITGNKIVFGANVLSGAGIYVKDQNGTYTIGEGCEITGNIVECADYYTGSTKIEGVGYCTGKYGTHTFASDVKIDGNYFNYASTNVPVVYSTGIHENGATLSIGGVNISTGKESVLDGIEDSVYSKTGKFVRVNGCAISPEKRAVLLNGSANALTGLGDGAVLYLGKRGDSTTSDFGSYGTINITGGDASDSYTIQRTNWDNVTSPSVFATINGYGSSKASSFVVMGDGSKGNWSFNGIEFYRGPSIGKGAFRIESNSAAAVTFNQCRFNMCYAYADEKMGGAIYMNATNGSVTLNKTTMSDCFATTSGGGVAVCAGTLTVGGDTSIDIKIRNSGCTDRGIYVKDVATLNIGNAYVNEIYLDDCASVNVNADLTTDKVMTIIPKSYAVGSQIVTGTNLPQNVSKFVLADRNYYIDSSGTIQKASASAVDLAKFTNSLKSGDNVLVNLDTDINYSINSSTVEGQSSIIKVPSGATLYLKGKTGGTTLNVTGNNYNVNFVNVMSGGTLILEGVTLSGFGRYEALRVNGGTAILKNCKITGINPNNSNTGAAVYVGNNGSVEMDGGEISANTIIYVDDGIVYVDGASSSFTMKNGAVIKNNTISKESAAGVYIQSGTFTMESGSGSSVQHSGTGYAVYNKGGTFNQNGCTVSGSIGP